MNCWARGPRPIGGHEGELWDPRGPMEGALWCQGSPDVLQGAPGEPRGGAWDATWAHKLMGPWAHRPIGPWAHGPIGPWAHKLTCTPLGFSVADTLAFVGHSMNVARKA